MNPFNVSGRIASSALLLPMGPDNLEPNSKIESVESYLWKYETMVKISFGTSPLEAEWQV